MGYSWFTQQWEVVVIGGRWDIFNSMAYLMWWRVCSSVVAFGVKCLIMRASRFSTFPCYGRLTWHMLCNHSCQTAHEAVPQILLGPQRQDGRHFLSPRVAFNVSELEIYKSLHCPSLCPQL